MKINKIELKNFKFHHHLGIDVNGLNCLIYGENGTGKSSIYLALYSNFYCLKDINIDNPQLGVSEKYKHREYRGDNLEINIDFVGGYSIKRFDEVLENKELLREETIYFANERLLSKITEGNFFDIANELLGISFPSLTDINVYRDVKNELKKLDRDIEIPNEILQLRIDSDKQCIEKLNEYIPLDMINKIIKEDFKEDFEIEFNFKDSNINVDNFFSYPDIKIKVKDIDDGSNIQNHFNEAKLKLIGIAIFFALAKKYEDKDSNLKLLVLDDFLTSLDMANRKLIVQYLLDNFNDYQKIILTHNIQFYNLITKLLRMRNENDEWEIKNIFLFDDGVEKAIVSDKEDNYLQKAKDELDKYNLEASGNLLRKEFEKISNNFEQLLELGRVEELQNIINALKKLDNIFPEPRKNFNEIYEKFKNIINNASMEDEVKYTQIKSEIEVIEKSLKYNNKKISCLSNIITKTEFYKSILMNPASHDDSNKELYRKEFLNSIKILEDLNKIIGGLK